MGVLSNINPKSVLYWFEEITKIPRGSGNMEKISSFCEEFAKKRNLFCLRDEFNNIIIKKPGTSGYENSEPVIIQGHLDMVCEKKNGVDFNFETDPLKIKIEGDFITADGTTLGADNGIAVAYALALLDSNELEHPELEVLLTVDEEIGLLGAACVDMSSLKGKRLINIDIEDEGVFTVGCAGGSNVDCMLPVNRENFDGYIYEISVSGLQGGHSGVEIDKNRANSNVVAARLLNHLSKICELRVFGFEGGMKNNVIPVKTDFTIVTDKACDCVIEDFDKIVKNEYKTSDKDIAVSFIKRKATLNALNKESTNKIIFLLTALPDGIQKMSADIKGLPETSLNMGISKLKEDKFILSFGLRSSVETQREALTEKLITITEFAGGTVDVSGVYPGWEYNQNSALRKIMIKVFEKMYGKKPVVEAIHAGLECGMFCNKIKGLDCISIGPDMYDIHTPMERVSISSVKNTWEFLLQVLKELK